MLSPKLDGSRDPGVPGGIMGPTIPEASTAQGLLLGPTIKVSLANPPGSRLPGARGPLATGSHTTPCDFSQRRSREGQRRSGGLGLASGWRGGLRVRVRKEEGDYGSFHARSGSHHMADPMAFVSSASCISWLKLGFVRLLSVLSTLVGSITDRIDMMDWHFSFSFPPPCRLDVCHEEGRRN